MNRDLAEKVVGMRLPVEVEARLQKLMDRNTNGELSEAERQELETFVELSQAVAPLRAKAFQILGRKPIDHPWPDVT